VFHHITSIAGKILKEIAEICSDILTIIYKKSMETGQVPLDWNHENVTPVYKKGDKHHPANYRPNVCIFFEYFTSDVVWTSSFLGLMLLMSFSMPFWKLRCFS
jgi:hypothetical protein